MMFRRVFHIALREYLSYVRTKGFILSIIMLPLALLLAFGLPRLMEGMSKPPRDFTVIDRRGNDPNSLLDLAVRELADPDGVIRITMRDYVARKPAELDLPEDPEEQLAALWQRAIDGNLFAYAVLQNDAQTGEPRIDFFTVDPSADDFQRAITRLLSRETSLQRLRPFVPDETLLTAAIRGLPVETHAVSKESEKMGMAGHIARALAPMAFVYLLWIAIMSMSSHLLTSTIEEKSSRIIEVMLSSASPIEFLSGKLGGLAAAGITTVGAWVLSGVVFAGFMPSGTAAQVMSGLGSAFTPLTIVAFLLFFLLGFVFYSSVYLGIGSVCNTIREAQSLLQPVMMVFLIPLFLMWYVTNNPDHIIAVIGSFIPPFTPFLMMNRIPANPPAPVWQILLAAAIMIVSTWASVAFSAKIFRVGILMYGKAPTLPEILRWARERR
jgi:ABC-type Na+ efflux pump permease subunit